MTSEDEAEYARLEAHKCGKTCGKGQSRSKCCTCGILFLIMFLPVLTMLNAVQNFEISESQGGEDVFHVRTKNKDLIAASREWAGEQIEGLMPFEEEEEEEVAVQATQTALWQSLLLIYHAEGGNVFTEENVRNIREAEDLLFQADDFDKFCLLESAAEDAECSPLARRSVTQYFYGKHEPCAEAGNASFAGGGAFFGRRLMAINQSHYCFDGSAEEMLPMEDVMEVVAAEREADAAYFLSPEFTEERPVSAYSRSIVFMGGPLQGYSSTQVDEAAQLELVGDFLLGVDQAWGEFNAAHEGDFECIYFSTALIGKVFVDILIKDALFALGSVCFILFYMMVHTRSWFLAVCGLAHILISFPLGYWLYTYIFGIREFFGLSFLGIYVILAIGADDVFVFVDAWKSSFREPLLADCDDLSVRWAWVFNKAAKAMLVTSLTTAVAFFVTAISPLPTVSAFGVFSACLVILNYIFVITYYPAIVMLHHLAHGSCCKYICCSCCQPPEHLLEEEDDEEDEEGEKEEGTEGAEDAPPTSDDPDAAEKGEAVEKAEAAETVQAAGAVHEDANCTERLLQGPYYRLIGKGWGQAGVLLLFVALTALFASQATQLSPSTKAEQFLPEDHPLQRFFTLYTTAFVASADDDMVQVQVLWGAEELDKSGVGKYDLSAGNKGSVVWDADFALSDPATQALVVDACATAANDTFLVRNGELSCVLGAFQEWVQDPASSYQFYRWLTAPTAVFTPASSAFPLDVDDTLFNTLLAYFLFFGAPAPDVSANFRTYAGMLGLTGTVPTLDVAAGAALYMPVRMGTAQLNATLVALVEALAEDTATQMAAATVSVRYVALAANSTLRDVDAPAAEIEVHFEAWEAFVADSNARGEELGIEAVQGASKWVNSHTQTLYVQSAIQGVALSLGLAFLMLFFFTGNLILAFLALLDLTGVVTWLLGCMVLLGWELGSIESTSITVLVGLSVDYVVHLAMAYTECREGGRRQRVLFMLKEMGHTVVGGGITSVGASLFLFACQIQFFAKFGWFMCLTCGFSLVWSLGFFATMCMILGPEHNTAQILWRKKAGKIYPEVTKMDP